MYFKSSFEKKEAQEGYETCRWLHSQETIELGFDFKAAESQTSVFSCILCLPEMSEWLAPTTVQGLGRIFKVPMGAFSWFTLSWTVCIRTEPTSALLPESGIFYKAGILIKRSQPVSPLWGTCRTGFCISLVSDPTYHAYPFSWCTGTQSCTLVII